MQTLICNEAEVIIIPASVDGMSPGVIKHLEGPQFAWLRAGGLIPERSREDIGLSPRCSPAAHRGSAGSRGGNLVSISPLNR